MNYTKLWQANRTPLITGITACYNKADFVVKAVSSVMKYNGLDQEDFVYILWDQGAPYACVAEFLRDIQQSNPPNVKVMGGGVNIGIGAALNRVIEMTDSEFIFKFDDDSELLPLTLPLMIVAYMLAQQSGFPVGVLSADVLGVGKANPPYELYQVAPGLTLECTWCVGGGAVLIGRNVLENVGPFREDRLYGVEDGDFGLRATEMGYRNAYLRGAYHISKCRSNEADPEIDKWKLEYYGRKTDLPFDEWKKCEQP